MNEIIAENVKVMFMFKMFFCNLHVLENEREDVFSFHETECMTFKETC